MTRALLAMTPFQHANLMLRNGEWEQALCEYSALWGSAPYLRDMISWNMNYLLKKAPADTVSSENCCAAIKLLEKINSDPALRVVGQQKKIEQNDPKKILDEYVKRRIADKTLHKIPDERTVLRFTHEMVKDIGHEAACLYADQYLPERLRYTLNILKANAAISYGDEISWLSHLNQYLMRFGVEPLYLQKSDSILSRFHTKPFPFIEQGPLVTVIMPAWNAQNTVEFAVRSILNQTWRPLELIIIDDASEDSTWTILQKLTTQDSRIKILRNKINVGPYVSKNIALTIANGEYITGHDADDWAHPLRIQNQVEMMIKKDLISSLTKMIRINNNGIVNDISACNNLSHDGILRVAFISCMVRKDFLDKKIGYWDSVRFGADSEIIERIKLLANGKFEILDIFSMFCLSSDSGLTNHPVFGKSKDGSLSPIRKEYSKGWKNWHDNSANSKQLYLSFPVLMDKYQRPNEMKVSIGDVLENMYSNKENKRVRILSIYHDPFMKEIINNGYEYFDCNYFNSPSWPKRPNSTSRLNLSNYQALGSLKSDYDILDIYKEKFDSEVKSIVSFFDIVIIHQTALERSLYFIKDLISYFMNYDVCLPKPKIIFGTEHTWSKAYENKLINNEELEFIYCDNLILRHTPKTDKNAYELFHPKNINCKEFELGIVPDLFSIDSRDKEDLVVFVRGPEERVIKNNQLIDEIIPFLDKSSIFSKYKLYTLSPPYSSIEYWDLAKKAKFLVLTSNSETFSYVLNDARALGVVAFHPSHMYCTSFGYAVVENYPDSPHKFFSIPDLVNQMEKIASNKEIFDHHSRLSRTYCEKYFSVGAIAKNWEKVISNSSLENTLFIYDNRSGFGSMESVFKHCKLNGYKYAICYMNTFYGDTPSFSVSYEGGTVLHLSYFLTKKNEHIFRAFSVGPLGGLINAIGEEVFSENKDDIVRFFSLISRIYKISKFEFDDKFENENVIALLKTSCENQFHNELVREPVFI